MHIPIGMRAAHLLGVDLMQPVLLGKRFTHIVVHAVDGFLRVGVFLDLPIFIVQIIGEHVDRSAHERVAFARAAPLFAVEDEGLCRFCMAVLNEDFFDCILDGFHVRSIAFRVRRNKCDDFVGKRLRPGKIVPANGYGRFVDGPRNFFLLEWHACAVTLNNPCNHGWWPPLPK